MARTYRDELDILVDKVEGNNDYEWTELVDELELNCHPDSLRKSFNVGRYSGYRVYKYFQEKLEDEYFADGTLDTEKQYSYTEAGNKDSITTFNGNGEMMLKEVFRYNAENVLTEITTYGADNKVASRTIVKFDDKGNFTKMTTYTVSKKFGTTVNEMSAMTEVAYEY